MIFLVGSLQLQLWLSLWLHLDVLEDNCLAIIQEPKESSQALLEGQIHSLVGHGDSAIFRNDRRCKIYLLNNWIATPMTPIEETTTLWSKGLQNIWKPLGPFPQNTHTYTVTGCSS